MILPERIVLTQGLSRMLKCLDRPIIELKGIGPSREAALAEAGIRTWRDWLLVLPRRFHVRPSPKPFAELEEGEVCAAQAVVARRTVSGRGRRRNLVVTVKEGDRLAQLVLFNRGYLKSSFKPGRRITFQGKVTSRDGLLQLLSPDYHLEGDPGQGFPGLIPVYSLPEGLFPRTFHRGVDEILKALVQEEAADWRSFADLPPRGFMDLKEALCKVHRPACPEEGEAARRRIAYEEFFSFQLGMAMQREERARAGKKEWGERAPPPGLEAAYVKCLPFTLTKAQARAREEIARDLRSPAPMHRLLQGDVGSGKTAVALYPLLAAALAGGQAALMAPTEVLARQHMRTLEKLLEPATMRPAFLRAGLDKKSMELTLNDPEARIVVGTHALIQERVAFQDLRVCVIDEQHKFGVRQRWNLKAKGREPDVLVMTATPIPRSLALTLYGELDITVLDEMPPGREPVATFAASTLEEGALQERLEEEIASKGRVFFVCPLIHESEKVDLEAAVALHGRLKRQYENRCEVALLHGAMAGPQKEKVLAAFREGEAPLLVTTVVVEVGVDVPEASTVAVLDAWRFGLSQLHQIRGRVGRGDRPSQCWLVGEPPTEAGRERIRVIGTTSNGFRIAEEDLRMRGPGEALGLRQHGLPPLKAGDFLGDVDLMAAARDDARTFAAAGRKAPDMGFLFAPRGGQGPWIG